MTDPRGTKTRSGILSCHQCGGDGRERRSHYGGNDPDVWDAGPCKWCDGSGEQLCEDCGEYPATVRYTEGRDTFMLCSLCHKEWLEDE